MNLKIDSKDPTNPEIQHTLYTKITGNFIDFRLLGVLRFWINREFKPHEGIQKINRTLLYYQVNKITVNRQDKRRMNKYLNKIFLFPYQEKGLARFSPVNKNTIRNEMKESNPPVNNNL